MGLGYWLARSLARFLALILFGWRVEGCQHLPATGGFIVAANHISYADPPLIGAAAPRRLAYMAKSQLFAVPLLSALIRFLGAFPIRREGLDRSAIRGAVSLLSAGQGVLIFPTGTRQRGPVRLRGRPGVSLLAAQAGVPVVPVRIDGSAQLWDAFLRRRPLRIRFGAPLAPPRRGGSAAGASRIETGSGSGDGGDGGDKGEDLRAYTDRLMDAIEALAEES